MARKESTLAKKRYEHILKVWLIDDIDFVEEALSAEGIDNYRALMKFLRAAIADRNVVKALKNWKGEKIEKELAEKLMCCYSYINQLQNDHGPLTEGSVDITEKDGDDFQEFFDTVGIATIDYDVAKARESQRARRQRERDEELRLLSLAMQSSGFASECQENHQEIHEAVCKERAAELRDEILFKQPESRHYGDCPICFFPLPLDDGKLVLNRCCYKIICNGCMYSNTLARTREAVRRNMDYEQSTLFMFTCPFCRHTGDDDAKEKKMFDKRVAMNDPVALLEMGRKCDSEGDYKSAFQYTKRAADSGYAAAHYALSTCYRDGDGVEKDEQKRIYHLEEAAIAGHLGARFNLGVYEWNSGRYDRAVKHFIIAANLGCDESLKELKVCYKDGFVSKDDLAAALRAHQAAVDATKSPQREEAENFMRMAEAESEKKSP